MPPKANKSPKAKSSNHSMEDLQQELLEKISTLTDKFENLEATLLRMSRENEDLKVTVLNQAKEIAELRNNLNEREQYARNWSMRCLNMPVPKESENDTRIVMKVVYETLIHPILEGARVAGDISSVPNCETLLETAHILPGKSGTKPVIVRFYSRYWRNLVFRHRKDYAPREEVPATNNTRSSGGRAAKMKYPFFEDLTRATFQKLAYIKQQSDVTAAWTVNGSIRFRTKESETIYRVSNLLETFEDIVG